MAKSIRLFAPTAVTTSAVTLFTNTAGTITKMESLTISQPAAGLAKTIRVSVGALVAGTSWFEYPVPAGAGTYIFYPGVKYTGTEICQVICSADTGVAIVSAHGSSDIA